jgi:hypothetical protein
MLVPDPHTEFRGASFWKDVTANLGCSANGLLFGSAQAFQLKTVIITGVDVSI